MPLYNPRFLAFATHYGFRPLACKPRRPQTKGKVEKKFHFVETNLLCGRSFRCPEHLNEVTAAWLKDVADVRVHRETKQTPRQRFEAERPHLLPLPAVAYDTAPVVYRTVNAEGFITYRQNGYSVPWRHLQPLLDEPPVTPRPTTLYQPLCEEAPGPHDDDDPNPASEGSGAGPA